MSDFAGAIFSAIAGAFILWLISKYYKRSRLYCAPSRLYEYSSLADGSTTVQLVVANKGRQVEESVEVQLSTDYQYSLLASTQNGIDIPQDKVIRLTTLLASSEVSLIFVAEGKPRFSKESIRGIRSRTSKGIVASSLGEAEAQSPGAFVFAFTFMLFVAAFGYFFGSTVGEPAWTWLADKLDPAEAQAFTEGCATVSSNAPSNPKADELSESMLKGVAVGSVEITKVALRGDKLTVDVLVKGVVNEPIEYSIKLMTNASDSATERPLGLSKMVYDIVLSNEGEIRRYTLSDLYPESRIPKRFWLETRAEMFGYWVTAKRSFSFGGDTSLSCSVPPK